MSACWHWHLRGNKLSPGYHWSLSSSRFMIEEVGFYLTLATALEIVSQPGTEEPFEDRTSIMGASPASPGGGVYHSHFRTRMACAKPRESSSFWKLRRLGALWTAEGRHLTTFALWQLRAVQRRRPTATTPLSEEKECDCVREGNPSLRGPSTTIGDTFLARSPSASPSNGADPTRGESWGPEVRVHLC